MIKPMTRFQWTRGTAPGRALLSAGALVLALALFAPPAVASKADKQALELYKKAVSLGNEGKIEEATKKFQEALSKGPKHPDIVYLTNLKLGLAYKMQDRWPEALAAYDAAIASDRRKKKSDAHEYLGDLYRDMGLAQMAVEAHKEAIDRANKKKKKKLAGLHYELARDYMDMKLYADAQRELEKAAELNPEKSQYQLMLGNALALNEKYDEATKVYEKLLEHEDDAGDAMYGLGFVERKQGHKKKAKEWFRKACKKDHKKACEEAKDKYRALH